MLGVCDLVRFGYGLDVMCLVVVRIRELVLFLAHCRFGCCGVA